MIEYIDTYRDRLGVEAICRTLRQTECGFITSRGYRAAKTRAPSARSLSDALLIPELVKVYEDNFSVYGVRKMWKAMQRAGWDIGRDQTARLMKLAGIQGRRRGRTPITTVPANAPDCRPDLVNRGMSLRRSFIAATTTVALAGGLATAPSANAYTVDYNAETDKCTITYTERDQQRINDAYQQIYRMLADETMDRLAAKEETNGTRLYPYTPEKRNRDIKLVREHAAKEGVQNVGAQQGVEIAKEGSLARAQWNLFRFEQSDYYRYIAFMNASKTPKMDQIKADKSEGGTFELTPAQAEENGKLLGLDLKGVIGAVAGSVIGGGGLDAFVDIAKTKLLENGPEVAAPIVTYTKSMGACTDKESESSSVPAGSSLSVAGVGGLLAAGVALLFLITGLIGFALRPVVDEAFNR